MHPEECEEEKVNFRFFLYTSFIWALHPFIHCDLARYVIRAAISVPKCTHSQYSWIWLFCMAFKFWVSTIHLYNLKVLAVSMEQVRENQSVKIYVLYVWRCFFFLFNWDGLKPLLNPLTPAVITWFGFGFWKPRKDNLANMHGKN